MPKVKQKAISKGKMETRSKSAAKGKDTTSSKNTPKQKPTPKSKKGARLKDDEPKIRVVIPKTSRRPPFFFSTDPDSEGGFLSPWYICSFEWGGSKFVSAGQLITACWAEIAHDMVYMLATYYWYTSLTNLSQESYEKILAATSEEEIKALADNIKDFPIEKWVKRMFSLAS